MSHILSNKIVLDLSLHENLLNFCSEFDANKEYILFDQIEPSVELNTLEIQLSLTTKEYPISISKISGRLTFAIPSDVTSLCLADQCIVEGCTIEEDITFEDQVLPLNNTIIIKGSTTLNNTQIIVSNPPGSKAPIIVDGGTIQINSSKFIYNINDLELYESIKDGESILIIETINGGSIDGEFENVELIIPSDVEDCRKISGTIVRIK